MTPLVLAGLLYLSSGVFFCGWCCERYGRCTARWQCVTIALAWPAAGACLLFEWLTEST